MSRFVNGGWSSWGYDQLGVCSVTCGVGARRRYQIRTCTNPAPENGGKDCGTGSKRSSTVSCDTEVKCPVVNGGWSSWGYDQLGVCSATCGVGSRRRYQIRTCTNPAPKNGGKDCGTGNNRSSKQSCDTNIKCPVVNGGWSSWGYDQLGVCSVTCGVGSQRRYQIRTCTNPAPKNGGKDCGTENKRISTVSCITNIKCPVVNGAWSRWSYDQLGVCSVTCGVGSQRKYQIRTCTNPAPQNGGKDCGTGNKRILTVSCKRNKCPNGHSSWSSWNLDRLGVCSVTCGVGSRTRYQIRTCTNPASQNGGKDCGTENKRSSTESCDTQVKCPESVFGPGLIAAVSVSGVFLIFLAVAAVVFFRLRRRIGKKKSNIKERPVSELPYVNDVTKPESNAENLYETTSSQSPENLYEGLSETREDPNDAPSDGTYTNANLPTDDNVYDEMN
ncbi:coadhesin-like [Gigantopelta aegis]|uniref:coadhesin-like n=1 Tax=Gigantopelta aegis TaxID=1735272 RepID=UPI001B88D759|nr:coadhesin-like [Gigantopelta aegis]